MDKAELDLSTILGILRRQKRLLIGTVLVMLAAAAAYLLVATPIYRASVLIQMDGRSANLLDPSSTGQEQSAILDSRVAGEVEILRSDAIALAVVEAADLIADDEFGPQIGWLGKLGIALGTELDANTLRRLAGLAPKPAASARDLVGTTQKKLQDAVRIDRRGLTYLIEITVSSASPSRAAAIANTYARVYIERQVSAKTQAAITARDVLRRQIGLAQGQLTASENAINAFVDGNLTRLERETQDPAITALRQSLTEAKLLQADRRKQIAVADVAMASQDWTRVAQSLQDQALAELARQRAELGQQLNRTGPDSPQAIDLTAALAGLDKDLQLRSGASLLAARADLAALDEREAGARDQLKTVLLSSDLSAAMMTELFNLQQSTSVARDQYQTLLAREQDLGALANLQLADARIVSEALAPKDAAEPDVRTIAALALISGLGIGLVLSFLREFHMGGVISPVQLGNVLQAPVPVSIGLLPDIPTGMDPADMILTAPMSLYAENFRKLRAAVDVGLDLPAGRHSDSREGTTAPNGKIVLVCSAQQGEGKSTTALALARTYAEAGIDTLLIDADMRKPDIGARLGIKTGIGLIDFLAGDTATELHPRPDPLSALGVVIAGEGRARPTDQLLNGPAFRAVIDAARAQFAMTIIDSPPILPVVDTRYLARHCDAILHVVRHSSTPQAEIREAAAQIRDHIQPPCRYMGVLNFEDTDGAQYRSYGYYGQVR